MSETFKNIVDNINSLSKELENGNIFYKINFNNYTATFKNTIAAINLTINNFSEDSLYIVEKIKDFADSNFKADVKDFNVTKKLLNIVLILFKKHFTIVSFDISNLIYGANDGKLD